MARVIQHIRLRVCFMLCEEDWVICHRLNGYAVAWFSPFHRTADGIRFRERTLLEQNSLEWDGSRIKAVPAHKAHKKLDPAATCGLQSSSVLFSYCKSCHQREPATARDRKVKVITPTTIITTIVTSIDTIDDTIRMAVSRLGPPRNLKKSIRKRPMMTTSPLVGRSAVRIVR